MDDLELELIVRCEEMERDALALLRQIESGEITDPAWRRNLRRLAESTLHAVYEFRNHSD